MPSTIDTAKVTARTFHRLCIAAVVYFAALLAIGAWGIRHEGVPYNVRELFAEHSFATLIVIVTGPLLCGAALNLLVRCWRRRPYAFAVAFPLLATWGSSLVYIGLSLTVPRESIADLIGTPILDIGPEFENWFRFAGLCGGPLALCLAGWRLSLGHFDRRLAAGMFSVGLIALVSYRIVVVHAATDNLVELLRGAGGLAAVAGITSCLLILGLTLGWLSQCFLRAAEGSGRALGAALLLSAISLPLVWLTFLLATNPRLEKYGEVFSAAQFLLSPARDNYLGTAALFARFAIGYVFVVNALGLGGALSLSRSRSWTRDTREQQRARLLAEIRAEYLRQPAPVDAPEHSENSVSVRSVYGAVFCLCACGIVYGSLVPFRFEALAWSDAIAQFRAMFDAPWRVPGSRVDWSVNFLITVPLGFCGLGAGLADRSSPLRLAAAAAVVLILGTAFSVAVEFAQVWFAGRVPSLKDVAAQSLGTLTGIATWTLGGRRFTQWLRTYATLHAPREKFDWFLQAYVLGFLLYSLLPLDVITTPRELVTKYESGKFELIPFSYRHASVREALYAYATDVLRCIPIGLWAVTAWRRRGAAARSGLAGALLGVLVVAGAETLQALIVTRYTSTTDLLLGAGGVLIGVLIRSAAHRRAADRVVTTGPRASERSAVWLMLAVGYAVLLPAVFWAPYEFTQDVALVKERLRLFFSPLFARMQSGSDLQAIFSAIRKFVWFMPLGVLAGVGIAQLPVRRAARRWLLGLGTLGVFAVALSVELGQVLLPDAFADFTDALICFAGAGCPLWSMGLAFADRPPHSRGAA